MIDYHGSMEQLHLWLDMLPCVALCLFLLSFPSFLSLTPTSSHSLPLSLSAPLPLHPLCLSHSLPFPFIASKILEDCSVVLPRASPAVHPPAAAKESESAMLDLSSSTPNQEPIPEGDCPASERDECEHIGQTFIALAICSSSLQQS